MTSSLLNIFIVVFLVTACFSVSSSKRPKHEEKPQLSDEERGFITHKHKCGGEFDLKTTALLEAFDDPDDHQFRKECVWNIKVDYGYNVAIKFNSMDIDDTSDTRSNYVAVRDDDDGEGTLIGVYRGNKIPPSLRSIEDGLTVKFVSNSPARNSSFSATVSKIFDDCVDRSNYLVNSFVLPDDWHPENICGKTFGPTDTQGKITNPCYPHKYPRNRNCVWKILAPVGVKINLNFKELDLVMDEERDGEVCRDAFLEVFSMEENNILKNHGRFCGSNLPNSILSEGNALEIIFKTNSYYNIDDHKGFMLEFSHDVK